jgi:hypothetical protein
MNNNFDPNKELVLELISRYRLTLFVMLALSLASLTVDYKLVISSKKILDLAQDIISIDNSLKFNVAELEEEIMMSPNLNLVIESCTRYKPKNLTIDYLLRYENLLEILNNRDSCSKSVVSYRSDEDEINRIDKGFFDSMLGKIDRAIIDTILDNLLFNLNSV